ncbi:adenylate cyclase [Rhodococcus sp. NPDC003318]|uniref:adenylate cyclase n=1 Tax=Rhodococcus sp. NPDC003318 TaxID=3364503 RepID=UPI0036989EEF
MEDIGVAFGYIVVIATIVVVTVGVLMLFAVSIKQDFLQRKPKSTVSSDLATRDRAA